MDRGGEPRRMGCGRAGHLAAAWVLVLTTGTLCTAFCDAVVGQVSAGRQEVSPTFTILFDNVPYEEGYRTSWGYSCLIQGLEKTILFDTGGDGRILLDNLETLGFDPTEIDIVVLSHFHGDHTGGLHALLPRCENVTVFLLKSFPDAFKAEVRTMASEVVEVSGPTTIVDGVASTGSLGSQIPEQSLVMERPEGLIVVTGCAHPGLRAICTRAREIAGPQPIYVMGGFHLRSFSKSEVTRLIEDLQAMGVRAMAPTHCTGGPARHRIAQMLGDRFVEAGTGRAISLEEIGRALR